MNKISILIAAVAVLVTSQASAGGEAAQGKKVFNKCKACHSLAAGKKKIGPSLHGVFGRTSGTAAGFNYSKAMKKAAVVWTPETLSQYLANPKKYVPGNRMPFPGLKKESDRENLMAYLQQATK
tara:strand:+ start:3041 stop:3412 length:372 start_codon:yes stop_codon:yes gene_type:complete